MRTKSQDNFVVKQDEDKVVLTKKLHKKAYLCRLLIQTSEEFKEDRKISLRAIWINDRSHLIYEWQKREKLRKKSEKVSFLFLSIFLKVKEDVS